jgi:hypothetical protein
MYRESILDELVGVIDQGHVVGAMAGRTGLRAIPSMSAPDPISGCAPLRDVAPRADPYVLIT